MLWQNISIAVYPAVTVSNPRNPVRAVLNAGGKFSFTKKEKNPARVRPAPAEAFSRRTGAVGSGVSSGGGDILIVNCSAFGDSEKIYTREGMGPFYGQRKCAFLAR